MTKSRLGACHCYGVHSESLRNQHGMLQPLERARKASETRVEWRLSEDGTVLK